MIRGEKIMPKNIRVDRMTLVSIPRNRKGWCWNDNKEVKAGDRICSVGAIRRGRSWGNYGGNYCAECPYFFKDKKEAKKMMGD